MNPILNNTNYTNNAEHQAIDNNTDRRTSAVSQEILQQSTNEPAPKRIRLDREEISAENLRDFLAKWKPTGTAEETKNLIYDCFITGAEELDLSESALDSIPNLSFLTNVVELDLSKNQLSSISRSFLPPNLERLYAPENQLIFASLPVSLTELDLEKNLFETVPNISHLHNLTYLNLAENNLLSISSYISTCKNLKSLILSNNLLCSFPDSLDQLENLNSLDLSFNKITTLSEMVHRLRRLTQLDLSHNLLTSLHFNAFNEVPLLHLQLEGNPFSTIPRISYPSSLTTLCFSRRILSADFADGPFLFLPHCWVWFAPSAGESVPNFFGIPLDL